MPPIWAITVGALLQGCGPLNIDLKDEAPQRPDNPDNKEREGDVSRVQLLEGLTLEDFEFFLPEVEGKDQFLEMFSSSAGNKIDEGWETIRIARYFAQEAPQFFLIDINEKDIEKYERQINRKEWENRRAEIHKTFRTENIRHPFVKAMDDLPVNFLNLFRSVPVFLRWSETLSQTLEQVRQNRALTILYPGSGAHVAPLMTAIQLIEQGAIDHAEFIYTEIDADEEGNLRFLLDKLAGQGVFEKFSAGPWMTSENEGKERVLEVLYQGKPIRILFALNRSGEEYYRREYFERADAVILHDPGTGYLEQSYNLLAKLLIQKKVHFPEKNQLILMEGEQPEEGHSHLPEEMKMEILEGPYGHCGGGAHGVGEVADCEIAFARSFLLNDPVLLKLVSQHDVPTSLSQELFASPPESQVFQIGMPPSP